MTAQVAVALGFLVICYCAWHGRPSWIRYIMIAAVLVVTLISLVTTVQRLTQPADFAVQGFDSGSGLGQAALIVQIVGLVLVPLYIVWYMNRGPARAFYRGYYLTRTEGQGANAPAEDGVRSQ